jgi:RNA 2',3'-cyclic 3'-phosphodiesterase
LSTSPEFWRIFCAIEFPPEVAAHASEHIKRLRERFPDIKASWTRDGNFHLTLKFIGPTPRARVELVSAAAESAVKGVSNLRLGISGTGVFPNPVAPKVLWLGIKDASGNLARLHARLEEECAREGFAKETRSFHPHLTLARVRQPQGARALAAAHLAEPFAEIEIQITELLVMRSELSSAGSKYTVISRHDLR